MLSCLENPEIRENKRISRRIDRELRKSERESKRTVKVLLLGTGESGKSTFLKQMRIIHGREYSDGERMNFTKLIYQNVMDGMKAMVNAMELLGIEYEKEENYKNADLIKTTRFSDDNTIDHPYWAAVLCLWSDDGIQQCYNRRNEYQLIDSAKYFLDKLNNLIDPEYILTEQDILQSRNRTTGIIEFDFERSGLKIKMVDVGGQRSERRKWLHCFEDVAAIIFLVAISEYDQVLFESQSDNRLVEAKNLFNTIINSNWFANSSVVLFLNKKDLLEEKIMYSHLDDHFPDYIGPRQNYSSAREFISNMFIGLADAIDKQVYTHFTCATDTKNIEVVFSSVHDIIMEQNIGTLTIS